MKKSIILVITIIIIIIIISGFVFLKYIKPKLINQSNNIITIVSIDTTENFLAGELNWKATRIKLENMNRLWGGKNIFVFGSDRAVVQIITTKPGTDNSWLEEVYEVPLTDLEIKKIMGVLIENDFINIKIKDRPGVPDETRIKITLINSGNESRTVENWETYADDESYNKNFGSIFTGITQEVLSKIKTDSEPVYKKETKTPQWDFVPKEFANLVVYKIDGKIVGQDEFENLKLKLQLPKEEEMAEGEYPLGGGYALIGIATDKLSGEQYTYLISHRTAPVTIQTQATERMTVYHFYKKNK